MSARGPRHVLITGGASGIGAAVVDRMATAGDRVTVLDAGPLPDDLAGRVGHVQGDVSDPIANAAAVGAAVDADGGLDVFIGNAGIHDGGIGIEDLDGPDLIAVMSCVMRVDVGGYVLGAQAAIPALRRRGGCMIFSLSDAAFTANGNGAGIAYTAAKHAGLGVVRYLATVLAPRIRVNAVAPGGIHTGLRAAAADGESRPLFTDAERVERLVRAANPLGAMQTAADVAAAYCFLASPAAAGMTGEVLRLDGGMALR